MQGKTMYDTSFYMSLYAESSFPLPGSWNHNQHWNMYSHRMNDRAKTPRDKTPIFVPSKMYLFYGIKEELVCDLKREEVEEVEIRECLMVIYGTDGAVTKNVMSLCHQISRDQEVTDLWLQRVTCSQLTAAEAPILSRSLQSLFFEGLRFICELHKKHHTSVSWLPKVKDAPVLGHKFT